LITVTPCYGRDYFSNTDAFTDWLAGKDFTEALSGKPVNRMDLPVDSRVKIRYHRKERVLVIYRDGEGWKVDR